MPSADAASHFDKSKLVLMPASQRQPLACVPCSAMPPSRQVLGMIAVSTALRNTP